MHIYLAEGSESSAAVAYLASRWPATFTQIIEAGALSAVNILQLELQHGRSEARIPVTSFDRRWSTIVFGQRRDDVCLPTRHRAVRKVSVDPAEATGAAAAISAWTLKARAAELSWYCTGSTWWPNSAGRVSPQRVTSVRP